MRALYARGVTRCSLATFILCVAACDSPEHTEWFNEAAVRAILARDPGANPAYIDDLTDATHDACRLPFHAFVGYIHDMQTTGDAIDLEAAGCPVRTDEAVTILRECGPRWLDHPNDDC